EFGFLCLFIVAFAATAAFKVTTFSPSSSVSISNEKNGTLHHELKVKDAKTLLFGEKPVTQSLFSAAGTLTRFHGLILQLNMLLNLHCVYY
ncbi:hypothetical protein IFM89_037311, partial [Coptis chinensis]